MAADRVHPPGVASHRAAVPAGDARSTIRRDSGRRDGGSARVMGKVLARNGRARCAAFVAIASAGSGGGLHPEAQPEGRSRAEDGGARLVHWWEELRRLSGSWARLAWSRRIGFSRAAVAGPHRFRLDRPLEGRRAAPVPARRDHDGQRHGRCAMIGPPPINAEGNARHPPARAARARNALCRRSRPAGDRR